MNMINFHLDTRSGVPTYLQIVQQVRQAIRLRLLGPGDQMQTVKDVVAHLAITPSTVLKAYRALDHEVPGAAQRGQGNPPSPLGHTGPLPDVVGLQREL